MEIVENRQYLGFLIKAYFIKLPGNLIDEDLSIAEKNYRTRFHFSCKEIENNMMNINCQQYNQVQRHEIVWQNSDIGKTE